METSKQECSVVATLKCRMEAKELCSRISVDKYPYPGSSHAHLTFAHP